MRVLSSSITSMPPNSSSPPPYAQSSPSISFQESHIKPLSGNKNVAENKPINSGNFTLKQLYENMKLNLRKEYNVKNNRNNQGGDIIYFNYHLTYEVFLNPFPFAAHFGHW